MSTETPKPAMLTDAERCGFEVTDREGLTAPCDRPATGHRWYQGHLHDDVLDVACDWHANEGGRRMAAYAARLAAVEAERDRLRAAVTSLADSPDDTQWWECIPYTDPPNEGEVVEVQVVTVDRLRAVLDQHPGPNDTREGA